MSILAVVDGVWACHNPAITTQDIAMTSLPDKLAPPTTNLLDTAHGLPDDLNSGFRSPDLGWVIGDSDSFNGPGGDCLFSNFWFAPIEIAESFAAHLANDLARYLPLIRQARAADGVDADEGPLDVAVCLWRSQDGQYGLVASISTQSEFNFWYAGPPKELGSLSRFDKLVHQVAGDGGDNDPVVMVYGDDGETEANGGLPQSMRKPFAQMLFDASIPEVHEMLRETLDEEFSTWNSSGSAPRTWVSP
jgi:hypothetical protein